MKLQISPNKWSCTPTALAMVLDVPVNEIIRLAGHDGSDKVWPEPFHNIPAGFHIHEIIDITYLYFRKLLCPFVRVPLATPDVQCPEQLATMHLGDYELRWLTCLRGHKGIMTGQLVSGVGHCVAWDGYYIYDPRGYAYPYTSRIAYNYEPDTFWMIGDQCSFT